MHKLLLVFSAASLLVGCQMKSEPDYATLISHRGESIDAPENTLSAFKTAVERGFGFECDIYLSKDKRLFTFHDRTLARTTAGANTNACINVNWSEISKLNVGGWGDWKGSKFDGERPALLEEALALQRPGRKIYVEVKGDNPEWVPYIKDTFKKSGASPDKTLFISFGTNVCTELKKQMPEFKVYWLCSAKKWMGENVPSVPRTAAETIETLRRLGADGVDISFDPAIVTEAFVKEIKAAGFELHVWTIDDLDNAIQAFNNGALTVTTNRSKYLLEGYRAR